MAEEVKFLDEVPHCLLEVSCPACAYKAYLHCERHQDIVWALLGCFVCGKICALRFSPQPEVTLGVLTPTAIEKIAQIVAQVFPRPA